jgi:tyrosyl-tRNA synthetase
LRQNVVYVDGQVADAKRTLNVGDSVVIQAGKKKIARVRLKS